jgi:hypothetical protein
MTTASERNYEDWIGEDAYDPQGQKIGEITHIYYDDVTGRPEWVAVKTGLFGMKSTMVPIHNSTTGPDGTLRLAFTKDQIKDAPSMDPDETLTSDQERDLWKHYSYNWEAQTGKDYGYGTSYAANRADQEYPVPTMASTRQRESSDVRLRRYEIEPR